MSILFDVHTHIQMIKFSVHVSFETFESVQTIGRPPIRGSVSWIWCFSKLSNLFQPALLDSFIALVPGLPRFDLLFAFTIIHGIRRSMKIPCIIVNANRRSKWGRPGTEANSFTWIPCVSNVFKHLVHQHCKVVAHECDVFWKFQICLNH